MIESVSNNQTVKVTTLGRFSVCIGDNVISDSSAKSQRVWKLFKYLITNSGKSIPTDRLIDILWQDGDGADNPTKALYSLMHRLRSFVSDAMPQASDFILFNHGSYICKTDGYCDIDCYNFERLSTKSLVHSTSGEQQEQFLKEAVNLYGGDYLGEIAYEEWVVPVAAYYSRIYVNSVNNLCQIYLSSQRYEEIVSLCERAISINNLEESFHQQLIRAYINMGRLVSASSHYEYVCKMLNKELGVEPSVELQALNREIHRAGQNAVGNITDIKNSLKEAGNINGTFYCDFQTFRHLYQLEMRERTRTGKSVFLVLITASFENIQNASSSLIAQAMRSLKTACNQSLRKGDVISQFSSAQLICLLSSMAYEDGQTILERIRRNFYDLEKRSDFKVDADFSPIDIIL